MERVGRVVACAGGEEVAVISFQEASKWKPDPRRVVGFGGGIVANSHI